MVNMYGAGKAFNLRYQKQNNHRFVQRQPMMRAPQSGGLFGCHGHHHSGPTNVTINNGPQGFWGFMGGLLGGLFGGGMMGGMFGPFNQINGGANLYGIPNQGLDGIQQNQDQTQAQQLKNLKTLFPKYNIVAEDGGQFSTIGKDGSVISGDYEEMKQKLAADSEKNTVDNTKKEEKKDDLSDGKDLTNKDNKNDKNVDNNNNNNVNNNNNSNNNNNNVNNNNVNNNNTNTRTKINLDGWYRSDTKTGNENKNLQLSDCKTAEEVINKVISSENKMDFLGTVDKADLTKQLISKNPSVFNSDGTVKANANWDKLDLPSINWIQDKYVSNRKNDGANVTYQSKISGSTISNTSQMAGAQKANLEKDYSANIQFTETVSGSWTNAGYGKATFTDSAGKTWTFTAETSSSMTEARGIADIKQQINEQIKAAGFTNTKLE